MSIRQALVIAFVCALLAVGRQLYGRDVFLWYLVLVGALGLAGTLLYMARQRRLARDLAQLEPWQQENVLIAIEEAPERPALAEALGRPQPLVPLRGSVEVFTYPRESILLVRGLMYVYLFFCGFVALGWASDIMLERTRFVDPATTPWWEMLLLIAFLAGGVLVMRWMLEATAGRLEISEEGVVYRFGERVLRSMRWDELTEAGISPMADVLWMRSHRQKLAVSNRLVGFGRAVNLVASRAAARSRWKAG